MPTANAPREALTRRLEAFPRRATLVQILVLTNEGKESSA
jgi:hypothetical protein